MASGTFMKIVLTVLTFLSLSLCANENWIKIEPINDSKTPKPHDKLDTNVSTSEPINKIVNPVEIYSLAS